MTQRNVSQPVASPTKDREHSQCFDAHASLDDVISCIDQQHSVLILMRGVAGSGKSHLAQELKARGLNGQVFSTDDFFYSSSGLYQFDTNKLSEYHTRNFTNVRDAIGQHKNPIIVDNTNVFGVHMKPYVNLAVKHGYEVYFVEPNTIWKFDAKECARRNKHGVPKSTIQNMLTDYEKEVSLEHLMRPVKLRITTGCSPASRTISEPSIGMMAAIRPSSAHSVKSCSTIIDSDRLDSSSDILNDKSTERKNQAIIELTESANSSALQQVMHTVSPKRQWKLPDGLDGGWTSGLREGEQSLTPPLVALSFEPPSSTYKVWCANRAVQVSDCRLLLANIGTEQLGPQTLPESLERSSDIACDESFLVEQPKKRPAHQLLKDRAMQTMDEEKLTAFDQLVAIFPDEDGEQLAHVLQSCDGSLEQAIVVLLDGGGSARRDGRATAGGAAALADHSLTSEEYAIDVVESVTESALNESATEDERNATVSLVLDERIADHLQRMFGPVTPEHLPAELLSPSQRKVRVPLGFALKLHQLWIETQSYENGEEPSIEGLDYSDVTPPGSTVSDLFRESAWPTFKDRLVKSDEAYARQLQDHLNAEDSTSYAQRRTVPSTGAMTLAEQLKLDKLYQTFPTFDRSCVKDMYDMNNRSFDQTKKTLQQYLEVDMPSTAGSQLELAEPTIKYSLAFEAKRVADDDQLPEGPLDYVTLHEESRRHAQQRNECYVKARNAFQERKPQVAAYYAEQGRDHDRLMNAANERAKNLVVKTRERQNPLHLLDLHGLHVDEALGTLKERLDSFDRPLENRQGPGRKLQVITGHGAHSKGGAKLKPAINQWLRQKGYKFEWTNPGEVNVFCK